MDIKKEEASKPLYIETMKPEGSNKLEKGRKDDELDHIDTYVAAEHAGTIVEHKGDSGRATLHPMPSLDPNDPLVRTQFDGIWLLVPIGV